MFVRSTPTAATELLASPAMLSPSHRVSGRNDVIYPPEFEEGEFSEVRVRKSPGEICRYAKIEALICSRLGETLTAAAPTRLIGS